ncbi:MAG TPA: hypothetical protein VG406_10585 [Isosphaeraceae bacterium]|jgi:hypothetical protein|nr:hypothetical protein [Isosphaeraceae bacterium]
MWTAIAVLVGFVAYLAFLVYVVALFRHHRNARALAMLTAWARHHGYQLLGCELRRLALGPFDIFPTPLLVILRFAAVDKQGNRRTGWARCGRRLLGLLDERVTVRWDREPARELRIEREIRRNRKSRLWDREVDSPV